MVDFINHFKDIKKSDKNLYNDFEIAWAEYEYIIQVIKTKIIEILSNDEKYWNKNGYKDVIFSSNVDVDDDIIIITIKPVLSIQALTQIHNLIGVNGRITSNGNNKHPSLKIIFKKEEIHHLDDE